MKWILRACLACWVIALSVAVIMVATRPAPARTVVRTVTKTRTVTRPGKTVIRYRPAPAPSPAPSPSPAAAPSPAASLPYGVTAAGAGYPAGSYFINCAIAQCVMPGSPTAGPFETTCSQPSTSMQLCNYQGGTISSP
jgi:hypothetical protein